MADLDAWLDLHPSMPTIEDPSCPGTSFNHRWDEDDYSNFQEQIAYYSDKVTSAYEEADKDKSLALWLGGCPVRRWIWVGPCDGSYGQAVTARSASGWSAVACSSAAARAGSSW
jgi:hypothetical protein